MRIYGFTVDLGWVSWFICLANWPLLHVFFLKILCWMGETKPKIQLDFFPGFPGDLPLEWRRIGVFTKSELRKSKKVAQLHIGASHPSKS